MSQPTFDALPAELQLEIFNYLDFHDLHVLRGTCLLLRLIITPLFTLDAPVTSEKLHAAEIAYNEGNRSAWEATRHKCNGEDGCGTSTWHYDHAQRSKLAKLPPSILACDYCVKLRPRRKFAYVVESFEKRYCLDCGRQPVKGGKKGRGSTITPYLPGVRIRVERHLEVLCITCKSWGLVKREYKGEYGRSRQGLSEKCIRCV